MMNKPDDSKSKTASLPCAECGGGHRSHDVLKEHDEDLGSEEYRAWGKYQICKCRGCGTVRFRESTSSEDDYDHHTGKVEERVRTFPVEHGARRDAIHTDHFPDAVERMYSEAVRALNAGAPVLAAGGLRATVEALCKDQQVPGRNLKEQIDSLVSKGLLAKPQADLLHEERFLGNSALHELVPPERQDLDAGLEIIETLLNTIYVLPARAKAMRERRNKKSGGTQGA